MGLRAAGLGLLLCVLSCRSQKLDPDGRNVCLYRSDPTSPVCCSGWKQEGSECLTPLCEGESACQPSEICVYPGFCRCKAGFYGASCMTQCPPEFWGPDCSKLCLCHPHGRCHPETGQCTCDPGRWGAHCQNVCRCGRHGQCNPTYGNCTCDDGWWTATCSKPCQCALGQARCDPVSGRCICKDGYWGARCSQRCRCSGSPCLQQTGTCMCLRGWAGPSCEHPCVCNLQHGRCGDDGDCVCEPGYRKPSCDEPCSAGSYGNDCKKRCGHCREGQPCSAVDGFCSSCEPGWNGTRCDLPCPPGYHGHLCQETCPRCRGREPCDPESGECARCEPGWTGPRCDAPCAEGTFGDACRFFCPPCVGGRCHHLMGICVCQPGFWGESCNSSCPTHHYGINCSSTCDCGDGGCHPATGQCLYGHRGALIAGITVLLLLVFLIGCCCCCCCCWGQPVDPKERVAVRDGGPAVRMKHHVYSVLANMGSAVPGLTLWSSGLPRVTVSHHDPELTFNHSFIEPPSSGWVSGSSSSFESDDAEAVYCLPPREDVSPVGGGEFQEMSSKCNMFLDPSGFSGEDVAFSIPRTSSIAKAKRPSVSFAEGTKFTPKERRGSSQEGTGAPRKSKSPWGVLMLSVLQPSGARGGEGVARDSEDMQSVPSDETSVDNEVRDLDSAPPRSSRRRTGSSTRQRVQAQGSTEPTASDPDRISTVYVMAGAAGQPGKVELAPEVEGPVQAVLRRLGSLQKPREAVYKPPRRKLGARVTMWEEAAERGASREAAVRKPSRRRHAPLSSPAAMGSGAICREDGPAERPASSILVSMRESPAAADTSDTGYLTIGAAAEPATAQDEDTDASEGPHYENVAPRSS
ncbi:scavenger receptor class F member 1 isoform X2 [Brienomyrus brachyistius]|uniref:scavenger receptor class F member 1 isoform X2 n=1 Tax=Brienomyrus brachyistius TaxID=42636 RepID=UPI0020B19DFD|nr:scavenger receptor class F member 1 isoform X2 [Brienomyrus brachyistius]